MERHGILDIIIIYFYILIKNSIVTKKNVNETVRKAAKTICMMDNAKSNVCILWIHLWQNEYQWNVNNFRSCKFLN